MVLVLVAIVLRWFGGSGAAVVGTVAKLGGGGNNHVGKGWDWYQGRW